MDDDKRKLILIGNLNDSGDLKKTNYSYIFLGDFREQIESELNAGL